MHPEYTDLLPSDRKRALRHEYYLRLLIVAAWLATVLVLIAVALFAPSYWYLRGQQAAKERELDGAKAALAAQNGAAFTQQLATLTADTKALEALGTAPLAAPVVRSALAVAHPGVALSGFAYAAPHDKSPGTLAITGTASTRDALRAYETAVSAAPFAASVDLPVSAYAQDADLPFTLTVTLAP